MNRYMLYIPLATGIASAFLLVCCLFYCAITGVDPK